MARSADRRERLLGDLKGAIWLETVCVIN